MRLLAPLAALAAAVLVACCAEAQTLGPIASLVASNCPSDSFYGDNFYMGARVVDAFVATSITQCCRACADSDSCSKWTYCDMSNSEGCLAPVGPLMNNTFAPGTCITSSSAAVEGAVWLSWSQLAPGVEWVSGEAAGNGTVYVESADDEDGAYVESLQRIGFEGPQNLFCRAVSGGSLQLTPLNDTTGSGASVEDGQELGYTGLMLSDLEGQEWAVVYLNTSSTSFWLYPADQLAYCPAAYPGCTPNAVAEDGVNQRSEEGSSCRQDSECCDGLLCLPRGVSHAQVSYFTPTGVAQTPRFAVEPEQGQGLALLPNECSRGVPGSVPGTGPRYDSPQYSGTALDWCLTLGQRCGQEAARFFCQLKGYDDVTDYAGPVGVTEAGTVLPSDGSSCSPDTGSCQTFNYIVCC